MTCIEAFPCGTLITTKIGKVQAMITAATIRFNSVNYEVSYFLDHEYKSAWLNESEFSTDGEKTMEIGFKSAK
jgi:hypothetical protein